MSTEDKDNMYMEGVCHAQLMLHLTWTETDGATQVTPMLDGRKFYNVEEGLDPLGKQAEQIMIHNLRTLFQELRKRKNRDLMAGSSELQETLQIGFVKQWARVLHGILPEDNNTI